MEIINFAFVGLPEYSYDDDQASGDLSNLASGMYILSGTMFSGIRIVLMLLNRPGRENQPRSTRLHSVNSPSPWEAFGPG